MIKLDVITDGSTLISPSTDNDRLSIIWNTGTASEVEFDENGVSVHKNCILFVSEFFMHVKMNFSKGRVITFDKAFLGPNNSSNQVGEFLMLFYGVHSISHIPKITLRENEAIEFEKIWEDMLLESKAIKNPVSEALLRNSFFRMLLLSQKIHMETEMDIPIDFKDLKKIREFQYLVNSNFKEITKVSDYAKMMKISPKKISELFSCCYDKKASELIADRRNLFARRQLKYTGDLVKNIAYDLNFSDSQTFSHFFKKQNGISPEEFRNISTENIS